MSRIPQDFIDTLLERTDIVSLVDARVSLKKTGREYQARCPFHDEKTPSFTVSPAKQFYHCFGCGAHGTAISFLMEYDRLEFRDAVELLAQQAGLDIPEDARTGEPAEKLEPLHAVMATADRFYRQALRHSNTAIEYLKKRGLSGAMAQQYGLGFAPPEWDQLASRLTDRRAAVTAGLLIEKDQGGSFDRFRNRIMFPIRDTRGRTIAFGGRTLGDDKAKYLNSPETPLFHKSRQMYGLFEARQALRELPRLLVVEGYMDVIALAQHGFANAVATLGTATTAGHLQTLFRHTEEVVFCFDGDAARQRPAQKAMQQCLPVMRGARRVRFLFLPDGEDPDSLVHADNGGARFQAAIDAAGPASEGLLGQLTEGIGRHTPDGRAQLVEKARPYVDALPPEAFRNALIGELATLAALPANDLHRLYAQPARSRSHNERPAPANARDNAHAVRLTPARRALALLMHEPALAAQVEDTAALRASSAPGAAILADAIDFFENNPNVALSRWLERYREHRAFNLLQQIAGTTPPGDADVQKQDFQDSVRQLLRASDRSVLRERYQILLERQAQQPLSADEAQELKQVLSQLQTVSPDNDR